MVKLNSIISKLENLEKAFGKKGALTEPFENDFIDKFIALYNENEKSILQLRGNINKLLNNIKNNFPVEVDPETFQYINTKTKLPVDVIHLEREVSKLRSEVELYHKHKDVMTRLANMYIHLSDSAKKEYWKKQLKENYDDTVVEALDFFINLMMKEKVQGVLLADLFQAFHVENGRSLLIEISQLIKEKKIDFKVKSGEFIQVEFDAKDDDKSNISAKLDVGKDVNIDGISESAFKEILKNQIIRGNPDDIAKISLQWAMQGSVPFGDTIDKNGNHRFYLIETFVTFLHEMGHIRALLKGEYFSPQSSLLPRQLSQYHQLEEYLNISVREHCENNMDPLKISRFGHTGIEFDSKAKLTADDFLTYVVVKELIDKKVNSARAYFDFQHAYAQSTSQTNTKSIFSKLFTKVTDRVKRIKMDLTEGVKDKNIPSESEKGKEKVPNDISLSSEEPKADDVKRPSFSRK